MALDAGTQLGRYTIRSILGAGGMGEVYLAQDTQLKRLVALKLLSADVTQNAEQLRRFLQEAHAASVLNHPNILTVYEIGQADGLHFISTEYVEGETLRQHIIDAKPELTATLDIAVEIASALAAAHKAGVVHRDIKPENIMIRRDGYVKVLDFGLAKLIENQKSKFDHAAETLQAVKTEPGVVMGTVAYMSPEQARGLEVDARTDVWSLGVVLYEMITGAIPFDGLTASDVMAAILRTEPPPLKRFAPKAPAELQRIIRKSLFKERSERYQTIKDMLLDLKSLRRDIEKGIEPESEIETVEANSIAILPFKNLTQDTAVSFYEFSLADAVITELARLRSLVVCPSSVVAKYLGQNKDPLEIGKELKVGVVLAANFLHAGQRIRVTTQLIDVLNGKILWVERIDAESNDIISVQDIITQRIVDGLQLKFTSSEQVDLAQRATNNSAAYEEYLRGRDRMRRYIFQTVANEDVEKAIEHFNRAVELDSKFALAFCGLGGCYAQRIFKGVGNFEDIVNAQVALDKGLSLDSQIIEARAYRVFIYRVQGERQKAYEQIAVLRREAPHNSLVHFISSFFYRHRGDYENALHGWGEMLRVDPTARVIVGYNRARVFMYQQRYEDAFSELEQAAAIEPDHPIVKLFYAVAVFRSGNPAQAADLLRDLLANHPRDVFRPYLAMCLSALGEHQAAQAQLTEGVKQVAATDPDVSYWLASAYVMENQREKALKWLERSINLGNENRPWLELNPIWKPLHDDLQFKELLNRIETRAK